MTTVDTQPPEFDLTGPLPRGVTVLEASAGTGKTYTIEGLVTRYVAGGYPLRRLLVVTFTRAATAELRDRVRTRMLRVADHLGALLDGGLPPTDDEVAALLAQGGEAMLTDRHKRLTDALADFDAATISTIHGFCQQVLAGVGLTGDLDRHATLIEDERDVVDAVVDDVLVQRFAAEPGDVRVKRSELRDIARKVVDNPDAAIVPGDAADEQAAVRVELARRVKAEVERRKRTFGLLSYNDLLMRLALTLRDDERGPAARERLRGAYDVALIDEFQDTDPVQWDILSRVFGPGAGPAGSPDERSLVLIGDPKQAVYSFRGADVYAYLRAAEGAAMATLGTNYRSDQRLLHAYNVVFAGAELGHPEIPYRTVVGAPGHEEPRLVGAPVDAALRLRVARRDDGHRTTKTGIAAPAAREHVARDVAVEAVRLLSSGAEIVDRGADGTERSRRPVAPGDIAVLVRSNAEAALVQRMMRDAGVPAVINGVGSVFATAAATEWLRLLEALEQPSSQSRARTAALTTFIGWTGDDAAAADDEQWDTVHERLLRWAAILRDHSVASLLQTIVAQERVPERLLGRPDGERQLTDLEHVGELLHAAAVAEELGAAALPGWLRERIDEAAADVDSDERARRLESDADAAQVLTVHRSKGLEFPVVFAPFLWSSKTGFDTAVPVFHDEAAGGRRAADVGGPGQGGFTEHQNLAKDEQRGEELRLVYVALTRARHQAVVWWMPVAYGNDGPLSRLLLCRKSSNGDVLNAGRFRLKDDDATRADLDALAARTDGAMVVESIPFDLPEVSWEARERSTADLDAAPFDRDLDLRWRRTSYSAITSAAHEASYAVGSEPDEQHVDDEALAAGGDGDGPPPGDGADETSLRAATVPLAGMPGGTEVGTFVHGVLEEVDFAADDLATEVRRHVRDHVQQRELDLGSVDELVDGLCRAIETPLGPLVGDLRLRDIAKADRLDEMAFELPLAGGSSPRGAVSVAAIGALLDRWVEPGDPLDGYAERLADPVFARDLRGYLSGSIDAVLRTPSGLVVVDYKTNWLGVGEEPLSAWHYRPSAVAVAMQRGHYPLQALLYVVALHRYLRWRMPSYSPDRDLGGVLYLFVRGMTGADVPRVDGHPCGVFSWQPPTGLVTGLSDLLDVGEVAA